MSVDNPIQLTLNRNDVGQVLDALMVLEDEWRQTAVYHEKGAFHDETVVRECRDASEARKMQSIYTVLIDAIRAQLN